MKINTITPQSAFSANQYAAHNAAQLDKQAHFTQQLNGAMEAAGRTQPDNEVAVSVGVDYQSISEQTRSYYQVARDNAHKRVDSSQPEKQQQIQFYQETMSEIMEMPIEVKVEPHEVNEALLFNNLGIDYLAYKELKVRIEMLDLTEQEMHDDRALPDYEKDKLKDTIDELKAKLEAAIDELLGDSQDKPVETEPSGTVSEVFSLYQST
ncbi:hypothetical protein [Pseudoalteromonas sp. OOF1S-7]|uniref:hypothetical protein n=1 Tax=Pseudoalteromonas sp. OOF1S-7 TaxID=2917757 RepID=UPI001EF3E1EE|nr:hypothetical protein [Pseudoalteromonas sp. OOF1S-7]MCG7534294.1 hypothetical protein [Pseudoalteromonas sp. OOF1S-7]